MKRHGIVLICSLLLMSCTSWETKKIPTQTYFSEEWKALNFHEVDTYPAFKVCEDLIGNEAVKTCFEREMSRAFYQALEASTFVVTQSFSDTVWVALMVDEKGKICIDRIAMDSILQQEIPQLPGHIHEAALELPKLYPATKKGIPVSSKYDLPIVIKVN